MPFHKDMGFRPRTAEAAELDALLSKLEVSRDQLPQLIGELQGIAGVVNLDERSPGMFGIIDSLHRTALRDASEKLSRASGIPANELEAWARSLYAPPGAASRLTSLANNVATGMMTGEALFSPGMVPGKVGFGTRIKGAVKGFKSPGAATAATTEAGAAPAAAAAASGKIPKWVKLAGAGATSATAAAVALPYYQVWSEETKQAQRDKPGGLTDKQREEAARANALQTAVANAETERTMQTQALAERTKIETAKFNAQAEIAKQIIAMQQMPAAAYADMAKTAAQQAAYLPKASVDIFDAISLSPAKDPRFASIANAGAAAGSAPPNQ